jgi:hypothetical protein
MVSGEVLQVRRKCANFLAFVVVFTPPVTGIRKQQPTKHALARLHQRLSQPQTLNNNSTKTFAEEKPFQKQPNLRQR